MRGSHFQYSVPSGITQRARQLRKSQTPTEDLLWQYVRNRRLQGLKFRRQHPVMHYILDFYCHEARLAIECDGSVHDAASSQAHDEERRRDLHSMDIKVLRFRNEEICSNIEVVLQQIADHAFERIRRADGPIGKNSSE